MMLSLQAEELPDFIGENGCFSSIFDFSQTVEGKSAKGWYACRVPEPDDYKRCCFESQRRSEGVGFFSNIIENHDEPRGVSYYLPGYAQNLRGKKLLAAMYFMLKGLPFIYQGQEIGMENMRFASIDEVDGAQGEPTRQTKPPHRGPHAERTGKDKRAPGGKRCLPARVLLPFSLVSRSIVLSCAGKCCQIGKKRGGILNNS